MTGKQILEDFIEYKIDFTFEEIETKHKSKVKELESYIAIREKTDQNNKDYQTIEYAYNYLEFLNSEQHARFRKSVLNTEYEGFRKFLKFKNFQDYRNAKNFVKLENSDFMKSKKL